MHWGVARIPAALLAAAAVALVAIVGLSGGSSSDPRTPEALPGLPTPFLSAVVLGDGRLTAALDAYGNVVDLRAPGPAGEALIENPAERQATGTVPVETGIVPRVSVGGGPPTPLWRADEVWQLYERGNGVIRTIARVDGATVRITCAAAGEELGCLSRPSAGAVVTYGVEMAGGRERVHLDDPEAPRVIAAARRSGRAQLTPARSLGPGAPRWARRLYERSLLVLAALTDRRTGAVSAGARDGWAYVWPRDAGAVAIALAAAGLRPEARKVTRFLLGLDLGAAARFHGDGSPVAGREAQGDAAGWVEAAARAAGITARVPPHGWQDRPDYQEKTPGLYLANALSVTAAADRPKTSTYLREAARRRGFLTGQGLVRRAGEPWSGPDSAAAWAVRPFARRDLFPAARRTLSRLLADRGRFGIVPSEDWPEPDPWTAPTAWSAWSFAALGDRRAALGLLADLRRASTPAGLLPERVDARTGVPTSTTPLAWSHAFAILALRQLWPAGGARPEP